jgi:hypothetical protein
MCGKGSERTFDSGRGDPDPTLPPALSSLQIPTNISPLPEDRFQGWNPTYANEGLTFHLSRYRTRME